MKFSGLKSLVCFAFLLLFANGAQALNSSQITITQKTGPYFILDHNKPATGPRGAFVTVQITNNTSQPIVNLLVKLDSVIGSGFLLGKNENNERFINQIAANSSFLAAFYVLYPSCANSVGRFNFKISDHQPGVVNWNTSISTYNYISASAGGLVNTRRTSSDVGVGQVWTDTIRYHFGNMLIGDQLFFQPISNADYDCKAMFLKETEVLYSEITGINAGDKNVFFATATGLNHGSNGAVVIVNKYVVKNVGIANQIIPVCATLSGNFFKYQTKYADKILGIRNTKGKVPELAITKSVDNEYPSYGDTIHYLVQIENLSSVPAYISEIHDILPEDYTFIDLETESDVKTTNSKNTPSCGANASMIFESGPKEGYFIQPRGLLKLKYRVKTSPTHTTLRLDTNKAYISNGYFVSSTVYAVVRLNGGQLPITNLSASIKNNQLVWSVEGTSRDAVFQIEGGEQEWATIALIPYQWGKKTYSLPISNFLDLPYFKITVKENGKTTLSTLVRNTALPEQLFSVYPQPFTQSVQLTLPKNVAKTARMEVYDSQGRSISSSSALNQLEVNTENWAAGVYFFHLIENGQRQIFKGIKVAQ